MIERKFSAPVLGILLLAASAISLIGCGEKEPPQEPPSPVAPLPQAPVTAAPAPAPEKQLPVATGAEVAMKKSDCFTCHAVDKKIIGPAYSWVAYRYKDDKEAASRLVAKIKNGGVGQWNAYTGSVVMTPHPQLSDDEIKAMVEWVLSQTPVPPPKV